MRKTENRFAELEILISKLHDGIANDEELRRIEDILSGDPDACEFYLDYTELCVQMDLELGARTPLEISNNATPIQISQSTSQFYKGQSTKQILSPSWKPLPWIAAAAVVLLFAGSLSFLINKRVSITPSEAKAVESETITHDGLAILMESVGANFVDNGMQPTKTNGILYPGEIILESGITAIEFYSGARVILEGPAILELTSENSAILREGRIRAQVPPQACGFSVSTPQIEVIDLGTEFGMNIEEDGHLTEVHCFSGLVDIYEDAMSQNPKALRSLESGEAVRIQPNSIQKIPANSMAFISYSELAQTSLENSTMRHQKWQELIEEIRADEDILALYTFEGQGPRERSLVNQVSFQSQFSHGAIVGCRWTNGRWPSKGGLEFKSPSDRVHFQSNEPYQTITLSTWVRLDAMPRRLTSLLSSSERSSNSMDWALTSKGQITLKVQNDENKKIHSFTSSPILNRNMLGKWIHLASVFNSNEKKVSHYLNSREISEAKFPKNGLTAIKFSNAEIGNSSIKSSNGRTPIRYFTGRIDELAIFGRSLTKNSIEHLYRTGKPH
ncbi:MAG: LamG-like jellyroll fold domain-containing protein [Verrucomicrobiota bacterium]|nr:LamG-like jellyroll fold domain-containing protein [Verrucomicrobiota bacterium]MEE2968325.1 LamG-like jellyroll fold domain-containing protein [Verrucomicrobiota bacterium]